MQTEDPFFQYFNGIVISILLQMPRLLYAEHSASVTSFVL